MAIFSNSLPKIDPANPQEAINKLCNHVRYLQEQLEYVLLHLDSRNIDEIDTDHTVISSASGNAVIGSYMKLTGAKGEVFSVGTNSDKKFEFTLKGAEGKPMIYLNDSGELVITEHSQLANGGE